MLVLYFNQAYWTYFLSLCFATAVAVFLYVCVCVVALTIFFPSFFSSNLQWNNDNRCQFLSCRLSFLFSFVMRFLLRIVYKSLDHSFLLAHTTKPMQLLYSLLVVFFSSSPLLSFFFTLLCDYFYFAVWWWCSFCVTVKPIHRHICG